MRQRRLTGGFQSPASLPDGQYPVPADGHRRRRLTRLGSSTSRSRSTGRRPRPTCRRPRGRTIVVASRDGASSDSRPARSAVRNNVGRALPSAPDLPTGGGKLRAKLDRGNPRYTPTSVVTRARQRRQRGRRARPRGSRVTSVTSQRLSREWWRKGGRVRVKFGRPVTIRGQLVLSGPAGRSPGSRSTITTTPRVAGAAPCGRGDRARSARTAASRPACGKGLRAAGEASPTRACPGTLPAERRLRADASRPPPRRSRHPGRAWGGAGRVAFHGSGARRRGRQPRRRPPGQGSGGWLADVPRHPAPAPERHLARLLPLQRPCPAATRSASASAGKRTSRT